MAECLIQEELFLLINQVLYHLQGIQPRLGAALLLKPPYKMDTLFPQSTPERRALWEYIMY
jgi:hypothetical protein